VPPKVIYINIDDSLGEKDKDTRHLEPIAWFFDHSESTRSKPRYKNGFCYVVCTMRVGPNVATLDLRLYLREKTVRRLNRKRPKGGRLSFRSKYRIARQILVELAPLLPKGWKVYVQFDSWYASQHLIKFIRRRGWHVTCALKCNRRLNGKRLDHHARALRHRWYTRVRVTTADGDEQTYYVRRLEGRLAEVPYDVRVYFSKRHPREKSPAYIGCTDLTCSAKQALQGYAWRWSCETVNFYLKTQIGLAGFRVQSYEAVDKYVVVVHLAWAYAEQRFAQERSALVRTYGDIIRQHRDEHAIDWLQGAIKMAIETGDPQLVLRRFLRLASLDDRFVYGIYNFLDVLSIFRDERIGLSRCAAESHYVTGFGDSGYRYSCSQHKYAKNDPPSAIGSSRSTSGDRQAYDGNHDPRGSVNRFFPHRDRRDVGHCISLSPQHSSCIGHLDSTIRIIHSLF